ncbi:MAG: transposase domain-containing protein, partial [Sporomusa sp.]
ELSNNRAERSIKPFVIGRKNWLFCNTPAGAKSSGAIYSLIQTAMENGLNPQAYLEYVFKQIQQRNGIDVGKMLPWAEEIPESCKILINRS